VLQRPYHGKSTACAAVKCRSCCAPGPRARDGPKQPAQRRGKVGRWLTEVGINRTRGGTGSAASSIEIRLLRRPESKKVASERFLVLGRSSCGVRSGLECRGAAGPRRRGLCSEQRQSSGRA
jgi:hypothetical protein